MKRLLEKYSVNSWLPTIKQLLEMPPEKLRSETAEELFSGSPMGNMTGLSIMKMNGHKVLREEEANFELDAVRAVLYEEAKFPTHGETAKRSIKHFRRYPTTHEEWEDELLSENLEGIFDVLLWITYFHDDWQWVQDWCLQFLDHPNPDVRALAVNCLADLAQLHKTLDTNKVVPRLQQLMNDPEVQNSAEEAMRDINSVLRIFS
jgi:hypothetical protein